MNLITKKAEITYSHLSLFFQNTGDDNFNYLMTNNKKKVVIIISYTYSLSGLFTLCIGYCFL